MTGSRGFAAGPRSLQLRGVILLPFFFLYFLLVEFTGLALLFLLSHLRFPQPAFFLPRAPIFPCAPSLFQFSLLTFFAKKLRFLLALFLDT
jgi:hypothetical protein